MADKLPGPQLVEAARKGTLNLDDLVDNPTVAPIHVAAILGTDMAKRGLSGADTEFAAALAARTGYTGFVPGQDYDPVSSNWFISEVLSAKSHGDALSPEQIKNIVGYYVTSAISDEHMAAFLGAVMVKGMKLEEIVPYTQAMADSGKRLDFSELRERGITLVDKHSTGGIADGVSLVLAPLVAATDPRLAVPMMSGRGLGHTGGTLDKLEAIPGFRTQLTEAEIQQQLRDIGLTIFAPTPDLAPADGRIYRLRDAVNCIAEDGLVVGSILSKKLAEGTQVLVMDTKTGSGAFFADYAVARNFAQTMCDVGTGSGLRTAAFITDMNEPLGRYAGNKLEVIEAVELLQWYRYSRYGIRQDSRFMEVVYRLAQEMITLADPTSTAATRLPEMMGYYTNGGEDTQAYKKFADMVEAQGGKRSYLELLLGRMRREGISDSLLLLAHEGNLDAIKRILAPEGNLEMYVVRAQRDGYLASMQLTQIGEAIRALGAGRYKPTDTVNPDVGAIFLPHLSSRVKKGDTLAFVLHDGKTGSPEAFDGYFTIADAPPKVERVIKERVAATGR